MSVVQTLKYKAFLSYSHADTATARWLHRRLEKYAVSEHAQERDDLPTTLRPIFRDRDDFNVGHSLTDATIAALEASAAMIVLCSSTAGQSTYVNEEVRLFKATYPDRPIVPIIADTTAAGGIKQCFPAALVHTLDGQGQVTDVPQSVLAADMRSGGDGRELALAKVVASLIGVPSDTVFRRAERDRLRARRRWQALAAVFAGVAMTGVYFGWRTSVQSVALFDTAKACAEYRPKNQTINKLGVVDPLQACIASLEALRKGAATDPRDAEILRLMEGGKRAEAEVVQVEAAEDDEAAGTARTKKAVERYLGLANTAGFADPQKGMKYSRKVIALEPNAWQAIMTLAINEYYQKNFTEAKKYFLHSLDIEDLRFELLKPVSRIMLGSIARIEGKRDEAMSYLRDCGAGTKINWGKSDFFGMYRLLCSEQIQALMEQGGDLEGSLKISLENYLYSSEEVAKNTDPSLQASLNAGHFIVTNQISEIYLKLKKPADAIEWARRGAELVKKVHIPGASSKETLRFLVSAHVTLAQALVAADAKAEAASNYERVVQLTEPQVQALDEIKMFDGSYFESIVALMQLYFAAGDTKRVQDIESRSTTLIKARLKPDPRNEGLLRYLAINTATRATFKYLSKDYSGAHDDFVKARELASTSLEIAPADETAVRPLIDELDTKIGFLNLGFETASLQNTAQASFAVGEFHIATQTQATVVENAAKLEKLSSGQVGGTTKAQLGTLAWYALFARDFAQALSASDRAIALAPTELYLATNKAHALMFLGRTEEARALYELHKGKPLAEGGDVWDVAIVKDFAEFEAKGLTHPLMADVRALLAAK